jgi:hypothetical protein
MLRRKILLSILAIIVGIAIPVLIFLIYDYAFSENNLFLARIVWPYSYAATIFISLLYGIYGYIFARLWLKDRENRSTYQGIPGLPLLMSLPFVAALYLVSFGDSRDDPQIPVQIFVLTPLLSAFIGSWVGGFVAKRQK